MGTIGWSLIKKGKDSILYLPNDTVHLLRFMTYYAVISILVFAVAFVGSWCTSQGIASGWYNSITTPSWMPPGPAFGFAWTLIFILCAVSIIAFWKNRFRIRGWIWILALFILNGFLNVGWTALFFLFHTIGIAAWDAVALEVSTVLLMALLWKRERMSAYLLVPYAVWVLFAIYLNGSVWILNR